MSETPAKATEEPKSLPPGPFGEFLHKHNITCERLADALGVETILLEAKDLEATLKLLKENPESSLTYLLAVSGVEQPDSFESVYHLWSYTNNKELVVKVRIAKATLTEGKLPTVPSISNFWPAANWHERESYDLMGIHYSGHPYLRRILNPWDWEGYPLRRDYKQPVDALNDKNPHSMR